MRNHEESAGARQAESETPPHTLTESGRVDRLLEHWIALEERKLAILERQAAATERLAEAMGAGGSTPRDIEAIVDQAVGALERFQGNESKIAKWCGVSRQTLQRNLRWQSHRDAYRSHIRGLDKSRTFTGDFPDEVGDE